VLHQQVMEGFIDLQSSAVNTFSHGVTPVEADEGDRRVTLLL